MGLDISFDKHKAQQAGLEIDYEPNGSAAEIAAAKPGKDAGWFEISHYEWLQEAVQVAHFAGLVVPVDEVGTSLVIRANKWGSVYAPLTQWLRSKGIPWSEH